MNSVPPGLPAPLPRIAKHFGPWIPPDPSEPGPAGDSTEPRGILARERADAEVFMVPGVGPHAPADVKLVEASVADNGGDVSRVKATLNKR